MYYITEVMEKQKINLKNLARFVQCQPQPLKSGSKATQQSFRVNVVVLGTSGCGKTAFIKRFLGKPFPKTHEPTLEDVYDGHYTFKTFHTTVLLRIHDTDGSDRFPAMRNLAIDKGQAFIVMFKLNSKESFKKAKKTVDEVIQAKGVKVPIYLVGNKCDKDSSEHVVTTEEAVKCRTKWKLYYNVGKNKLAHDRRSKEVDYFHLQVGVLWATTYVGDHPVVDVCFIITESELSLGLNWGKPTAATGMAIY